MMLGNGKELGVPGSVLMNGKGPYRYNDPLLMYFFKSSLMYFFLTGSNWS